MGSIPPALLEKLKLLPLRERELVTLRQTHQHLLRWIQGSQELTVRLTDASTIPEARTALLRSLVEEFGFDVSAASTPECLLAGDPVEQLTAADRLFLDDVANEVRRARALVISQGDAAGGERTLGWLMGGPAGMMDTGEELVVLVGRTRRTAVYYPPPNELEAGLYRHLLSTVAQAFKSISLQSSHQLELERQVALRTRELKQAQDRVIQLERAKIAEQMAGGFAHEMRNALSGAKLLVEKGMAEVDEDGKSLIDRTASELQKMYMIAQERIDADALARFRSSLYSVAQNERLLDDVLRSVHRSVEQALSITSTIMEYSRIGYSQPGSDLVDPIVLAGSVLAESSEVFAERGIAATVHADGACFLRGTEAHFYSMLKNLVVNASDALSEVEDDRSRLLIVDVHRAADRVVIRVTDNANGIPDEIRVRIFEPFFSTKPQTGTGLGLGMVEKLVALHEGTLEFDTAVGRGTTFTLSFGAHEAQGGARATCR
jgi:signal transduction histidine kinase